MTLIQHFVGEDEGAALPEYGLLIGLIAVVCIGAITLLGGQISTVLGRITAVLTPILAG